MFVLSGIKDSPYFSSVMFKSHDGRVWNVDFYFSLVENIAVWHRYVLSATFLT